MIKTYYWKTKPNFGDLLSGLLLKRFCHLESAWSEPAKSDIVICGSILEHLPASYTGIIAGAGKLHEQTKLNLSHAKILGLRGYLTAKGIKGNYVVADPGLLADELVPVEDKEFDLGIVAHWTDKDLEKNKDFFSKKWTTKIIRVSDDPIKVIGEIGKCKKIVSSSLHGIILADAFGIPRRIEIPPLAISKPQQEGGLYKWKDYHSSIDMVFETGVTKEANRNRVTEKQHELYDMFQELKSIFNVIHK